MSSPFPATEPARKPGRIGLVVTYLVFAAVALRTFADESNRPLLIWYAGFELAFLILYTVLFSVSNIPNWLKHFILIVQSGMVLYAISWRPEFDFLVILFLLLTYPVALVFTGRIRWIWVLFLVFLIGGSLVFYLGILQGLALSLTTMAGAVVLPAFLVVNHEIEAASLRSRDLLRELQETHRQLQLYASLVQELAAVRERNWLARQLHDTVSQLMFSISLTTRSAQLLLEKDPGRVPDQLARLQEMTSDALGQLRSLITKLRPIEDSEKIA